MIDVAVVEAAADAVKKRWPTARPVVGIVLGSGWGAAVEAFEVIETLSYQEIPGLGTTGVAGHAGQLAWARAGELEVLIFVGRRHLFEGVPLTALVTPIVVFHRLGVRTALITNAAGGIGSDMRPGDLMAITDHINLQGTNPLVGPHREALGPRFPDMSEIYDGDLRDHLCRQLEKHQGYVRQGVYASVMGPSFETPAEIRMLRTIGADAVGMSTVPEAIMASTLGIKVAALSCISNLAAGISKEKLTHAEVLETAQAVLPRLKGVVYDFCVGYAVRRRQ